MNNKSRVVITGIGIVSASGIGVNNFFEAIKRSESSADYISNVNLSDYPVTFACQVKDFNPNDYIASKIVKHMERCSQFGVAASFLAVNDAKLEIKNLNPKRFEIVEGTSIGGMDRIFSEHEVLLKKGYKRLNPFTPVTSFIGSTSGEIAICLGIMSRSLTVCTGSASSGDAIGIGYERVRDGYCDAVLAGGAEAPIVSAIFGTFCRTGVLSTHNADPKKAARPFSKDRKGFVLGEGSAMLILESEEHALKRGATVYAEVVGYGSSCDAYHIVSPQPEGKGIAEAIKSAEEGGYFSLSEVDYINAHGTATQINDLSETIAFKIIFGNRAKEINISSTKPITGHTLGACGAIEASVCCMVVKDNYIPPTINYTEPDPQCDLNYVPNIGRYKKVNVALSCVYGFGGKNAVLAFRKYSK